MSLRVRLLASLAVALILSLGFGCALASWHAARSVRAELTAALDGAVHTVRNGLAGPLTDAELRQLTSAFDGNRHVRAVLFNSAGQSVARSALRHPASGVPRWFDRLMDPGLEAVTIPAGAAVIRLAADPSSEAAEVWGEFSDVMLALALFAVLMTVLTSWTFERGLRPIGELQAGLRRIGAGDTAARVSQAGAPELAGLAVGFNQMASQLAAMQAQNQRLTEQVLRLQDEERAELARNLHDEIGPVLFAVSLTAATIEQLAAEGRSGQISGQARIIQDSVAQVQRHVRELLARLRPARATERGLRPAVERLMAFWRERCAEIAFAAEIDAEDEALGEAQRETVYRVVQEAVSNAVRHGRPSQISVNVAADAGEVVAQIVDNGAGAGDLSGHGFGLAGMRERVAALAGTLAIGPAAGEGGWRVTARLPMAAA